MRMPSIKIIATANPTFSYGDVAVQGVQHPIYILGLSDSIDFSIIAIVKLLSR